MPTEDGTGLLDRLLADSKVATPGCTVCAWLADRDDAPIWDRAFLHPQITNAAIVRGMRDLKYPHKDKPISRHRSEKHRAV